MTQMLATDAAPRAARTAVARDHVFFSVMAFAMTAVVGIGFSRTYFHRIAEGSATPLIHIHGAVFAAWMVLFIAQALLVAQGRTRLHRRVGVWGVFFAVVMLVLGTVTGIVAARHGYRGPLPTDMTALQFLLVAPLRDMIVFGALTGAAIARSHDVQAHNRLMLMATLGGLVPAGAARLPGGEPTLLVVFLTMLAAGPVYDWLTRRRVHWAYVCGIAVTLLSSAVAAAVAQTSGWQSFAQTLID
jgi:hypothetical protein